MKKTHLSNRILSVLLALAMLLSFAAPISAADQRTGVRFEEVDNSMVSGNVLTELKEDETSAPQYSDTDMVRVSIFLNKKSTLEAGYSTINLSRNTSAMSYRNRLEAAQAQTTASIERAIGQELDVRWNLTLAANAISANVEYGQIQKIEKVSGVDRVVVETRYEPQEDFSDGVVDPNMVISSDMTGTQVAWESGYTGAGMRIAIIDTGLDIKHQSVDGGAFRYALEENAKEAGLSYEEYAASLDLLDAQEVADAWDELHVSQRGDFAAEDLYISEKLPFGFCYIDEDLDVTHENDTMTEHGSHVAGIAAANRYIPMDGAYVDAGETVGVVGNAPDAQLLVMKVFGGNGGAYDSDYMAAIEDAIMLGCDAINLSLGSANPGTSMYFGSYGDVLENMKKSDTVVSFSAGNSGAWADYAKNTTGLPYTSHVNFDTAGSPGSHPQGLTVASVNNDGAVSHVFSVEGKKFSYNETGDFCNKLVSLDTSEDKSGTEYEYVFLEGFGAKSDYEGIDVKGKVVFLSRGGDIAFADKAREAHYQGVAALVVYNNQPGGFLMDLRGYWDKEPAVSITQEDGLWIKDRSTAHKTDAGVNYYTGTFFMDQSVVANNKHSDYYTMSLFSSWGVPGDLSIKPEITAPGGNIYSINGTHSVGGDKPQGGPAEYELMSGTSMAAPQVTGISALVLQYIQENGLSQKGMTDRALAQSLLMSTATPMKDIDGNYYPIIQQGAGLVNTAAATSADSYVLVEGQEDGKVKAELKDDPKKTGAYTFTFSLNNLEDKEKQYGLSADLFIQNVIASFANGNMSEDEIAFFMADTTAPFAVSTTWVVDGQPVGNAGVQEYWDFNGDGKVDADDAQALLDYATGARETVENEEYADISGDGVVSSYDVHQFLSLMGRETVTLPAGGSVEVTVTLKLTDAQKEVLDTLCEGGAFIQAYVHIDAIGDEEGVLSTSHNIPMLAYYGSWTDSSMLDLGSYQEYSTGAEIRLPYLGNMETNSFAVVYGDEGDTSYYFGGNPIIPDTTYMPERNAINSERGDFISTANLAIIRNAIATRFVVNQDGETIYEMEMDGTSGAFYHVNAMSWQATTSALNLNWRPDGFEEGERFEIGVDLAPELYVHGDTVDWDAMHDGARMRVPVCVDNTAPVLKGVSVDLLNNNLVVTASDNQYVASAVLYNTTGTRALAFTGSNADAVPGETYDYTMSLDGINGKKFLLQVTDYALNTVTYEVEMQIGEEQPAPTYLIFDLEQNAWVTYDIYEPIFNPDDLYVVADVPYVIRAAAAVGDLVYSATKDGQLYVAPQSDLSAMTYVAQLPTPLTAMTCNSATGKLYGLTTADEIVEIDPLLGDTTHVLTISMMPTDTLAVDPEGHFYFNQKDRGMVFWISPEEPYPHMVSRTSLSDTPESGECTSAMCWNPNTNKLNWYGSMHFTYMGFPSGYGFLFDIDPAAYGDYQRIDPPRIATGAFLVLPQSSGSGYAPTDEVTDVQVSLGELTIHRGLQKDLNASVRPWFVTDRTVTWSSSDDTVATVDQNGLVTAVDVGSCEIYATSNLDNTKVGTCAVTVDTVDLKLEGVLKDTDGKTKLFTWDLAENKTWEAGMELDKNINSVTYDGDNTLFLNDAVGDGGKIYEVDKTTGEIRNTYGNNADVPLWDMFYSAYSSSAAGTPKIGSVWKWIFMMPDDPIKMGEEYFNLQNTSAPLFGVVTLGHEVIRDEYGNEHDSEHFVMIDGEKDIIDLWVYQGEDGLLARSAYTPTDLDVTFKIYDNENKRSSLVTDEAGNLYLSFYNGKSNDIYSLVYDASANMFKSELLANMGDGVWPAALYQVETGADVRYGDAVDPNGENSVLLTAETTGLDALIASMEEEEVSAGSLNVYNTSNPFELAARVKSDGDCNVDTVNVDLIAENDTTNGLVSLTYDASKVTLVAVDGNAELTSFASGEGMLTFGYAYKEAAPAGAVLASLTFRVEEASELAITTIEDGDTQPNVVKKRVLYPCASNAFADLDTGAWYHEYTDYVLNHGIMMGTGHDRFAPEGTMTRGMLVTTLYRMSGEPAVESALDFSDVGEDYYTNAIVWASENGITTGYPDGTFRPDAPVTREQAAAFLYRYVTGYLGAEVVVDADLSVYADCGQISEYAKEAIAWAVSEGMMEGFLDGTMKPHASLTRTQCAKLLTILDQKF